MSNLVSSQLFMFAAIFAIFYFVLIRPQQQQRKKHDRALLAMKKGDEVVTAGGLVGEIVHIRALGADGATTMEDRVTLKSGDARLVVERGRITRIVSDSTEPTKSIASASSAP
jgi:preprotein translocase subunit YajC